MTPHLDQEIPELQIVGGWVSILWKDHNRLDLFLNSS